MEYRDAVYGRATIDEPVLIALMTSTAVTRLHGVLQHGISGLIGITNPTTRFEHSVGSMLLVRRLGAGLEEQIAALLHDVSHTAFSHVIDYVFHGHDSQSYHEEMKESYMAGSDLPALLDNHGLNWRRFVHEEAFTLLEQPAPALCADRLDYFLRDSVDLGLAQLDQVSWALDHLAAHEGRIVVQDLAAARWLGDTYLAADEASWANFEEVGLYELTAQAIRRALEIGAISQADFWGSDRQLWDKLHASGDPELGQQLALVSPKTSFVWDDHNPDFRVSTKLRTIDPDVHQDGLTVPLSQLDPSFGRRRNNYLQRKKGKWPMRVVPG